MKSKTSRKAERRCKWCDGIIGYNECWKPSCRAKQLAILARKIAARDNNDALHNLAIDLQDAVDAEKDSAQIAEKVIEMLSAAQ